MTGPPQRSLPLGAVLAGGAAKRLGGAKATAELGGRPLISYPLGVLAQAGLQAVVIAKAGSPLPQLAVEVVADAADAHHPLAGVVAALRRGGSRGAVVVPCDAPFISPMLIRVLAGAETAMAVRSSDRMHPLIAFYPASALDSLQDAVEAGASAREALDALEPELIEVPERETFNVNTPADLERAESRLRRARS